MTEEDIITLVAGFPGVTVVTASEAIGAPEMAWGDSFFYYDPNDVETDRQMPFATIVTNDCEGFDTASNLNRPNVFRLNIAVGRSVFEELLGYPPAGHGGRHAGIDYSLIDQVLPHPVYATQGWVSILNPGKADDQVRGLLIDAHARAVSRHRSGV
jgi:hypothetical protein